MFSVKWKFLKVIVTLVMVKNMRQSCSYLLSNEFVAHLRETFCYYLNNKIKFHFKALSVVLSGLKTINSHKKTTFVFKKYMPQQKLQQSYYFGMYYLKLLFNMIYLT